MPTVQDILKQSGFTDEEIATWDAKKLAALGNTWTSVEQTAAQKEQAATEAATKAEQERKAATEAVAKAEQERVAASKAQEAAEVAKRANEQFYAESVAPALNTWASEKSNKEAEIAFYKTQLEGARTNGFVPTDAPKFTPPEIVPPANQARDNQGRYVANAPGGTPGSPTFTMQDVRDGLGSTLGTLTDIQWKYQTLYNKPMPISPTELVRQADAVKLDPAAYAARTFQFQEREAEIARKAAEDHDAKIKAEATAPYEARLAEAKKAGEEAVKAKVRELTEKFSSNPDVRIAQPSRFADVARAVKAGERPDPLMLNESQRKMATRQAIHSEIAENAGNAA